MTVQEYPTSVRRATPRHPLGPLVEKALARSLDRTWQERQMAWDEWSTVFIDFRLG